MPHSLFALLQPSWGLLLHSRGLSRYNENLKKYLEINQEVGDDLKGELQYVLLKEKQD